MDNENMAHIQKTVYLLKNETMNIADKWMEPEKTIMNVVIQTKKDDKQTNKYIISFSLSSKAPCSKSSNVSIYTGVTSETRNERSGGKYR